MAKPQTINRIIKTDQDLEALVALMTQRAKPFSVAIRDGEARTNPQNNTIHMWYAQAASELGDKPEAVRAQCKLVLGVPILRRENALFRNDYDEGFRQLPYERKLQFFQLLDPQITSLMKKPELTEYMEAMQKHFAQMGIVLTDPDEKKKQ